MEPQETQLFLQRARGGDEQAYDELFARVAPRILLYVRLRLGKRLGSQVEAEDVLQETYLEAHRAFSSLRSDHPGAFVRWLCTIADNRLSDLADHHGAKKRSGPKAEGRFSEIVRRLGYSGTGPATAFAREEAKEQIATAMKQLSDEAHEALLLRHFQGYTLAEIAEQMKTSEPTVRRLIVRAHVQLGSLLRKLTSQAEAN